MTSEKTSENSSDYFKTSWEAYRKVLEGNYMSHAQAYQALRDILNAEIEKPFSFLDLACGDAYHSSAALIDTRVARYSGIDLSEAALRAATEELEKLECKKELHSGDLNEFDSITEPPLDVIWVGLSVHHFDTAGKAAFMKRAYDALSDDGIFLIYEPVFLEGEDRGSYIERIKGIIESTWTGLSGIEKETLLDHVRETELPETLEKWIRLGKDAGFDPVECIFTDPSGLYGLFIYRK